MIKNRTKKINSKEQSITIFVMTEKGLNCLREISYKNKELIKCVVIGEDKLISNDYQQEIFEFCSINNLKSVRRLDFKKTETEYALAISWRWLIDHPVNKLIIFHDSILPKYRGFSPLVNALINGEKEIGVSAIYGAKRYDCGNIIAQSKISIDYPIKISEAIKLNLINYNNCIDKVLNIINSGEVAIEGKIQDELLATYSLWRNEDDYEIDWRLPSKKIRRFIDALGYPYKGAKTNINETKIRIIEAVEVCDVYIENRDVGKNLFLDSGYPIIVCGEGLLKITNAFIEKDNRLIPLLPLEKFRIKFGS
jgi:methionyl-tRNA formyltransferase